MSAGTDRIDAEIRKTLADRGRVKAAIEAKLFEVQRMRAAYAGTQDRINALLEDRKEVQRVERNAAAHAAIAEDIVRLERGAEPPPPTPPRTPTPTGPMPVCTCRQDRGAQARMVRGTPCPIHGHTRPSHL